MGGAGCAIPTYRVLPHIDDEEIQAFPVSVRHQKLTSAMKLRPQK